MTRVILVRHGETNWNRTKRYQGHSDIALNQTGIVQAQRIGMRLAAEKIQAVYSSDLLRAVQTATHIADKHGLPVLQRQELREINFGNWEGLTYEQIIVDNRDLITEIYNGNSSACMPNGESFEILGKRAMSVMEECVQKHQGENIVVVAHGGTLRTILCNVLGRNLSEVWSISQDNTAINVLEYENGKGKVMMLNESNHLALI